MKRAEIYSLIQEYNLQDKIKLEHKVNYTNLKNNVLESWVINTNNKNLIHLTEAGTNKEFCLKASNVSGICSYNELEGITLTKNAPMGTKTVVCSNNRVYYVTEDSNKVFNDIKSIVTCAE